MTDDPNPPPPMPTRCVVKTLAPGRPGTRRWQQRYGPALVCVRYRIDDTARQRLTTVELVVERAPLLAALPVAVRIAAQERELQRAVRAAGGRWDPRVQRWFLPMGEVRRLGLDDRIAAPGEGDR